MDTAIKELVSKADAALEAYRAASKAGDKSRAEAAYADAEATQKALETEIAAREEKAKEADLEARRKALETRSAGMLPVAQPPGGGGDSIPTVRYKAHDGQVRDYTPTGNARFKAADEAKYTEAFRDWMVDGVWPEGGQDLARAKALSLGSDAGGGFTVASEVMHSELVRQLDNDVLMRRLGRVLPTLTGATSIRVPVAASRLDAAEWTTEAGTGTPDTATPFAARSLTPHPLVKLVKVSNSLLRMSSINVEQYVREEGGYKIGIAEEAAFMEGTGAGQPEGIFTSSLPTDTTCTSATVIAYDDLVEVEFALPAQYRRNASWIMHRTILKEIHQLADGNAMPYLRRDPVSPMVFTLFGYPINESEYAPSSSASTLYVAALGDWKRAYWIAQTLQLNVLRLGELYQATEQVGYHMRTEVDGMVVDGSGVVRLKMNT